MTIRLSIAPGDHYDFEVKPFEAITVADYIRIHQPIPDGLTQLEADQEVLMRYSGAPSRYVRYMRQEEVGQALAHIIEVSKELSKAKSALDLVNETLGKWQEEHDGNEWTREDAKRLLEEASIFSDKITVDGQEYTAPDIENEASFGQWIDLQAQMQVSGTESDSYVRAMSVMMVGPDGPYPVQGEFESDHAYTQRCGEYITKRSELFMRAPWVKAMGICAFFFSKSQRFAELTGHNTSLLNGWLSPRTKREPMVIPIGGVPMPS